MRTPAVVVVVIALTAGARADAPPAKAPIRIDAASIAWKPAPPTMPAGTQIAVLEGDPSAPGIFTMRLRLSKGFALPPHTHPQDERVTVLEGSVVVALGDAPEKAKGRRFGAGAFYVTPASLPHAVWSDDGATLQLTGTGPWQVHAVAAAASRPAP